MRNKILLLESCVSCLLLLLAIFPPVVAYQTQTAQLQKTTVQQRFLAIAKKLASHQPTVMSWPFFLFFIINAILAVGITVFIIIYFSLINPSL